MVHSVVWEVLGGKTFSFSEKCFVQLNLVTELNYLQFGLGFLFYLLLYIIKEQNKTSQKANTITGGHHPLFSQKKKKLFIV